MIAIQFRPFKGGWREVYESISGARSNGSAFGGCYERSTSISTTDVSIRSIA